MSITQYGISVTTNRFVLSDLEDEDPLEILKKREKEQEQRKKTKLAEKENKAKDVSPKHNKSVPDKVVKNNHNSNADVRKGKEEPIVVKPFQQTVRFDHKYTGENRDNNNANSSRNFEEHQTGDFYNREERNNRFDRKENPEWGNSYGDSSFEGRRGRGGGTYVRGGRGRAGSRQNFDNRGKRDYERHSGSEKTGIKAINKREGFGARNWGNARDDTIDDTLNTTAQFEEAERLNSSPKKEDLEVVNESNEKTTENTTAITTVTAAPNDNEVRTTNVTSSVILEEPQQEVKELTLDEWKALKGPKQTPIFNIRKPGEGEDLSQWKNMYALRKKDNNEEDDEDYEYGITEYPQRVSRHKHVLDIDIHFRDMRGIVRGRGGRGRGGNRSFQNISDHNNPKYDSVPKMAPKVDDEHDFPSLS